MYKIIFFDVDGTLITGKTEPDFMPLADFLIELKKKGIIFGINTNRPWAETFDIYKKLKLNGPIILESGALYKLSEKSPEVLVNFRARNLNKKIIKFLIRSLPYYFPQQSIVVSNNKFLLKNHPLIFISKNRRYTSSIYIRNKKGVSEKDLNCVARLLCEKFRKNKFISFRKILTEGKIIVSDNFSDRLKTMCHVRGNYFPNYEMFIISDDEAVRFKKDINFCAVKNATGKYKKNCRLIAKSDGIKGIKNLIKKITNQL